MYKLIKTAAKLGILTLLLWGCSGEEGDVTVPASVLRQTTLIPLLADIHMAEAKLSMQNIYGDSASKMAAPLYSKVFHKHGVTEEELKRSIIFYTQHPLMFNNLYRAVIDTLQGRQSSVPVPEKPKADTTDVQPVSPAREVPKIMNREGREKK